MKWVLIDGSSVQIPGCTNCFLHEDEEQEDGTPLNRCVYPGLEEPAEWHTVREMEQGTYYSECPLSERRILHAIYCSARCLYSSCLELYYKIKEWWDER